MVQKVSTLPNKRTKRKKLVKQQIPSHPPGDLSSFTYYSISEIEQEIKIILAKIVESTINHTKKISSLTNLVAIVLGGTYGRGEAGFGLDADRREVLVERFEIRVIVKDLSRLKRMSLNQSLSELGKRLSSRLKVRVRFAKAISIKQLKNVPQTPYWYDLKWGHHILWGEETVLQNIPIHKGIRFTPKIALKMLLEQGNKLVLLKRKIRHKGYNLGLLLRELHEALLVCGSCYLIMRQLHTPAMLTRARQLRALEHDDGFLSDLDFSRKYWQALQSTFKLNMDVSLKDFKDYLYATLTDYEAFYFKLLSFYNNQPVRDERTFVHAIKRGPITYFDSKKSMKHLFANLFLIGFRGLSGTWKWYHPSYRLYASILGVLLDDVAGKGKLIQLADEALGMFGRAGYLSRSLAFIKLWRGI